ncbi:MAG: acyltransferase [Pseudomonadales bacterium]|nr:acyltransferase [Pseudomonadales bacterium]
MSKILITIQKTNTIRGLAIIAVIFLHILAYLPGIYNSNQQILYISLDQFARFCMPAFIILSGYGLATKYESKKINYWKFFKTRILKLIPLYLVWSIFSILIINSIPTWSFGNQPKSLLVQLLIGQADYQLYFLPVIFQLYAIFPVIWFHRKNLKLILFIALFAQIILYIYFYFKLNNSDRLEYTLFLSWIVYFIFGIYLKSKELPKMLIKLAPIGSVFSFVLIVFFSLQQINNGLDPLPALKFTKILIIPFGLLANLSFATINFSSRLLVWFGKNSYIIFLSHTIGLRIIYAIFTNQLRIDILMMIIVLWLTVIYLSLRVLNKRKPKIEISNNVKLSND